MSYQTRLLSQQFRIQICQNAVWKQCEDLLFILALSAWTSLKPRLGPPCSKTLGRTGAPYLRRTGTTDFLFPWSRWISCQHSSCHKIYALICVSMKLKVSYWCKSNVKKSKAIPVTGQSCEMLRIQHCLDNRLTVNCEILATCSSIYSPVRTSQEPHSISIK
jgi:hypothetical protein